MNWMERIIALAIIVVLLIFAIAQQVELSKVKAIVLEIQQAQPLVVQVPPEPTPLPTIVPDPVKRLVTTIDKHRSKVTVKKHKHFVRNKTLPSKVIDVTADLKHIIQDQNEIMTAQQALINMQKAVAVSDKKVADLKLKEADLKSTALQLEINALKINCHYETTYFTHNQHPNNSTYTGHGQYKYVQYSPSQQ